MAFICLFFGSLTLLTPIPTGIFLIAIGLALLVPTSPTAQSLLSKFRRRNKNFDRQLEAIEPRLPSFLGKALAKTRGNTATS